MKSMKLTSSLLLTEDKESKKTGQSRASQLSQRLRQSLSSSKRSTIRAKKRVSSSPYISLTMFSHCRSISNFNLGNFTAQIKQVDEDDELIRIADNSYNTE